MAKDETSKLHQSRTGAEESNLFLTTTATSHPHLYAASPELSASSGFVAALFGDSTRPSFRRHCNIGFCRGTMLFDSRRPKLPSKLHFAIPRGWALPANLATAVTSALVVSLSPGRADLAIPEDTARSVAVETPCAAIPSGSASPQVLATVESSALVVSSAPRPRKTLRMQDLWSYCTMRSQEAELY